MHLTSSPAIWYAARASGVAAYVTLSVVVSLGLALGGKAQNRRWPRFSLEDVHRFGGLLVGSLIGVHVLTIAADSFLPFSLTQLLVPFTSTYRPLWTGLGIAAAELLVALAITNHYRRRLPHRFWRTAHYLNFAVWTLASLHGLMSGTDRSAWWLALIYGAAVATVLMLLLWRFGGFVLRSPRVATAGAVTVIGLPLLIVGPLRHATPLWDATHAKESRPRFSSSTCRAATSAAVKSRTWAGPASPARAGCRTASPARSMRAGFRTSREPASSARSRSAGSSSSSHAARDNGAVRVLVVEDEEKLGQLLGRGLREEGHAADVAARGEEALWMARAVDYDAIVLDVMLPGADGFEVCRRLRHDGVWSPVLMLTARDGVDDRIGGLDAGADDYLTKPFSFEELLARLRALTRRAPVARPPVLEVGDLRLDPAGHRVWRGEQELDLSAKEFSLLEVFMRRPGVALTRTQLLDGAWDIAFESRSNVVDVYVRYLRQKIDRPFGCDSIETVRRVGYRLRADR
jgi:two-component system OmpR family response regulator